jgi:hypothetical protein
MSDPMPADKVEVKVSGKTVFVNGKEIGTAKLECDAQLAARELQSAFAEVRAQAMEEAAKIADEFSEDPSIDVCCQRLGEAIAEAIRRRASGKDER